MGISASTTLGYGIPCGEAGPRYREVDEYGYPMGDDESEDFDRGDLEEHLAVASGLTDPWDDVPREVYNGPYDKFKEWEAANPEWRKRRRAFSDAKDKLAENAPVQIVPCGASAYDYTEYALVLADKHLHREGSDAVTEIKTLPQEPSPEVIQEAKDFCDKYGLRAFENPTWLLTTNMG